MKRNKMFTKYIFFVMLFAFVFTCVVNLGGGVENANIEKTSNVNSLSISNAITEEPATPVPTPVPPAQLGAAVPNDDSNSGIKDAYLYDYLLQAYNNYYGFTTSETKAKQIYVEMFSEMTELDLTKSRVTDLSGLDVLNLENIKVLKLGQNSINEVKADDIKNMFALEVLDLSDNNIKEFVIPTSLTNLKELNLNKNYITKIDISRMNAGKVYLSFNKITSINDITMPRIIYNTDLYVELFNNNILDADAVYTEGLLDNAKIKVELGLQGYGLNYKVVDKDEDKITPVIAKNNKLKFYNSSQYPNLKAVITNVLTNEVVKEISNGSNKITEYSLGVGEYKIAFVDASTGVDMQNTADSYMCAFKGHEGIKVVPTAPTVKFVVKNKEMDTRGKFSGKGLLRATNTNGEGDIYYSIAGGEWVKGNEVELTYGGEYNVKFKVVIGEFGDESSFESEEVIKTVKQSLNPYIPDELMLILIVAIILLLVFIVAPLIAKYAVK